MIPGERWASGARILALLAVLVASAGCSAAQRRTINLGGALLTTATLAGDWCQTRSAAVERWSNGRYEQGMPAAAVLGEAPRSGAVDVYFTLSIVAILGLGQLVPDRWRPALYGAVVGAEIVTIGRNLATTSGRCL